MLRVVPALCVTPKLEYVTGPRAHKKRRLLERQGASHLFKVRVNYPPMLRAFTIHTPT